MTDDQQAKCDDGCGVFCQEGDEFIDVEEDTEEGKMNYRKRHGAPLGLMGNSRVSRPLSYSSASEYERSIAITAPPACA